MNFQNKHEDIPRSKPLALTGAIFLCAPFIGAIMTVISIVKAFGTLKVAGSADPSELAVDISYALNATLIGLFVGLLGLILVNIALFRKTNREQWFYRSVLVLSVIWCVLLFPLGLIPGLILFSQFSKRKEEFSR